MILSEHIKITIYMFFRILYSSDFTWKWKQNPLRKYRYSVLY